VTLVAKTYWGGAPFHFRRAPRNASVEAPVLKTQDFREIGGLYWTPEGTARPRRAVLLMHPRVDFGHHYSIPRLLDAGMGALGANTRNPNNDTDTVHEEIVLDVAACVRWLREERGVEHVVLLGNSGGGSLFALYQAQARTAPAERIAETPAGDATRLPKAELVPADAMIYVSAHKGEGRIMNECIDPSVTDEADLHATEPSLDMYHPANGFRPAPEWCEFEPDFVSRYRAAQIERVHHLDTVAREWIAVSREAETRRADPDFQRWSFERQQDVARRAVQQPVMVVYRTMANLHYVDRHLDPSDREYGSLLSDRPDLMNRQLMGFGRLCTPRAWLSTWSGLASNADLTKTLPAIPDPTLVVQAGRDREIYPRTDAQPIFEAVAAEDRHFMEFPNARHYFEPDFGATEAPDVEELMDRVVDWIRERFEG
jgi:alpha-beta hydrolase superfamily lysophospholipase